MINIDITLLIQLVNFLITLVVINYLIIRPVRGVIARRKAANDELRERAAAAEDGANSRMEGYTARIAKARADAAALRENVKASAGQAAQAALLKAAEQARGIHREAADRVRAESAEARRELEGRVGEFVGTALKTMLG